MNEEIWGLDLMGGECDSKNGRFGIHERVERGFRPLKKTLLRTLKELLRICF